MVAFKVEGMTCGGCASRVTKAIQALDSTAQVNIDLRSKTVSVETRFAPATLAEAVTAAGYPATALSNAA